MEKVEFGNGLSVEFPFEPYPVQQQFMSKIFEALNSQGNALLESPTGTGKTLCLLCATIAWRENLKRVNTSVNANQTGPRYPNFGGGGGGITLQVEEEEDDYCGMDDGQSKKKVDDKVGPIIYASRTHAQLTQVIKEFKNTSYANKINMTVLGSRDQLCVNPKFKGKYKGTALNNRCTSRNSRGGCHYKNQLEATKNQGTPGSSTWMSNMSKKSCVMDIEDLVKKGTNDQVCPYYYSREKASETADIIFMPYNYVLEKTIRDTLNIDWIGSIVIFDEAHNLEKVATSAVSASFSALENASCIEELKHILTILKDSSSSKKGNDSSVTNILLEDEKIRPDKLVVTAMLKALYAMEDKMDQIPLRKQSYGATPSATLTGMWYRKMLAEVGFTKYHKRRVLHEIRKCADFLMLQLNDTSIDGEDKTSKSRSPGMRLQESRLDKLSRMLQLGIIDPGRMRSYEQFDDYKVYVCKEEKSQQPANNNNRYNKGNKSPSSGKPEPWVLNFWSFSPGLALTAGRFKNVRSFLLASGTLSPMDVFQSDMVVPFNSVIENPHVIKRDQVWIGAIKTGNTGVSLNSNYENRSRVEYKEDLGRSIEMICWTMLGKGTKSAPTGKSMDGGVLVFFPSYSSMEDIINQWKQSSVWNDLERAASRVFVEPRNFSEASDAAKREREGRQSKAGKSLGEPQDETEEQNFFDAFKKHVSTRGTCLLLAVCRGKVSEGMDFPDNYCRAVVITGIPYAPPRDAWVSLKKAWMDEKGRFLNEQAAEVNDNKRDAESAANTSDVDNKRRAIGAPNTIMAATNSTFSGTTQSGWSSSAIHQKMSLKGIEVSVFGHSTTTVNSHPKPAQRNGSTSSSRNRIQLSGTNWYVKSASMAVNQALGRIIRHKDDWGAIFLLDERFQHEQQINNLSKWLRPSVKKYAHCSDALKTFRAFLENKESKPRYEDRNVVARAPPPVQQSIDDELGWGCTLSLVKNVVVDENKLPPNEVTSFIDPQLLLTQPSSSSTSNAKVNAEWTSSLHGSDSEVGGSQTVTTKSNNSTDSRSSSGSNSTQSKSLFDIIGNHNSTSSNTDASSRVAKERTYADKRSHLSTEESSSFYHDAMRKKANTSSSRGTGIKIGGSSKSFGLLSSKSKVATGSSKMIASASWTVKANLKPKNSQSSKSADMNLLSSQSVDMPLDRPFRSSEASNTKTSTVVRNSGKPPLSSQASRSEELVQRHVEKKEWEKKRDRNSGDYDDFDVEKIQLNKRHSKPKATNTASKRWECMVCKESELKDPCAAACGHICCLSCWKRWMRVNPACPLCKKDVSMKTLKRLQTKSPQKL